jgi:hypothetical protein
MQNTQFLALKQVVASSSLKTLNVAKLSSQQVVLPHTDDINNMYFQIQGNSFHRAEWQRIIKM